MQLKVNDIITKGNQKRKVLEVLSNIVIVSSPTDFTVVLTGGTEEYFLKEGWIFPKVKRKLEEGELYWFMCSSGKILESYYCSTYQLDVDRFKIGNCYKTKEEAQEALTRVLQAYKG